LPSKSSHSWNQFMEIFLAEHQNNDRDELWNELISLWKEKEESIEQLFTRIN